MVWFLLLLANGYYPANIKPPQAYQLRTSPQHLPPTPLYNQECNAARYNPLLCIKRPAHIAANITMSRYEVDCPLPCRSRVCAADSTPGAL